jgi:hypothetical protein
MLQWRAISEKTVDSNRMIQEQQKKCYVWKQQQMIYYKKGIKKS